MKPAPFHYHAPGTVDDALALLRELAPQDAKVLAGGQSLVPLLNMRLARPRHIVDINGLRELDYIRGTDDGGLAIGALTRHRSVERSAIVAERCPLLAEAIPLVGDRTIRYRGTLGGSLAHADPVAELPTVLAALDAELVVRGSHGERTVPAAEFFVTYLTTALEPDDLLVEVRVPKARTGTSFAFLELARQHGAFAIVGVAAALTLEGGRIADARLALAGVGGAPLRASGAERALVGHPPGEDLFVEAARLVAAACDPEGDVHGTGEYRREMAGVYARRALAAAASRQQSALSSQQSAVSNQQSAGHRGRRTPPPSTAPPFNLRWRGEGASAIPAASGQGAGLIPSSSTGEGEGGGEPPARPPRISVQMRINGQLYERHVEPRRLLCDFIRADVGLTGTHVGCEHGVCGACTVVVGGEPVKSCLMLAVQAQGAEVLTVEGLAEDGQLHPIQQAFHEQHALQCGFCTPGMLLCAYTLLRENPEPSDDEIKLGMDGNLCRCTGYYNIVDAVRAAAQAMKSGQQSAAED